MGDLVLITGGARSGKSRFAESLAAERGGRVLYLATLQPLDQEMAERVLRHRESRPQEWRTVEEPLGVAHALEEAAGSFDTCVLDCITLWVSNLLLADMPEASILESVRKLIDGNSRRASTLIAVTNETGSGLVPEYELGRRFRDVLGEANQLLAGAATSAYLCTAGIAIDIKAIGIPIAPPPTGPSPPAGEGAGG